jgi:hypothetical protein
MRDYLRSAAHNNALWCDAVSSAQGAPGEFRQALWLNRFGTPPGYPNVVTLAPMEAAVEQIEAVNSLVRSPLGAGWAVKDSFRSLDLRSLGFTVLFDAEWILRQPAVGDAQGNPTGLPWGTVRSEADLLLWERAWAGEAATAATSQIFAATLMSHTDVCFLFAPAAGVPLCGGILNKGAGVIGLSNVFHTGVDPEIAWRGLVREAAKRFPGLPVVGYESGEGLAVAQRVGFQPMGPLRIWLKP